MMLIMLWEAEHGGGDITWMLWVALGFFALMVLVGWLSSRGKKPVEGGQEPEHARSEKHQ
jgi:hypothetical protein